MLVDLSKSFQNHYLDLPNNYSLVEKQKNVPSTFPRHFSYPIYTCHTLEKFVPQGYQICTPLRSLNTGCDKLAVTTIVR